MEITYVILNPQMNLLLELGADWYCNNLHTTYEVAMIIVHVYKQDRFWDIILAY